MDKVVDKARAIEGRKDRQSVTASSEPVETPIEEVKIVRSRNVITRNGYMTECFRRDWRETGYDLGHVIINRWETLITTDWHCHHVQTDHVVVIEGRIVVALYDSRPTSPSFGNTMTVRCDRIDPQMVIVPPQVFHAFKVLTAPAGMINSITEPYRYEDPDDWRVTDTEGDLIPLDLAALR